MSEPKLNRENLDPVWIPKKTSKRLNEHRQKSGYKRGHLASNAINFYLDIIDQGFIPEKIIEKIKDQ